MHRTVRRLGIVLGLGLLPAGAGPREATAQPPPRDIAAPASAIRSLPEEIRGASESWERRKGPARQVVDMVCLVPDLPTFLDAIATWDESHAFPILIDDVELTFKFLRAFRPARIVRYPRRSEPIPTDKLWDESVAAVVRSWSSKGSGAGEGAATGEPPGLSGDAVPRRLGPTPPGVVLSSPSSPMLAGAVALAAGRFQPLVRWETPRQHADVPGLDEARELAANLEAQVAARVANHGKLGDDCDFLTLAGDWPYRYRDKEGEAAFDDLIGRSTDAQAQRWAFTGRLLGDPTASVYRAMCGLFLQPENALLFNAYTDSGQPWIEYSLTQAGYRLARLAPVTIRQGEHAGLSDWSQVFDPINRYGLVMVNTHGSPTVFNLAGGPGQTGDIPPSVPASILMIHSFSATDPNDPQTIAGRWLANGAFIYFGAMNEPFLQAFRSPNLVAALLAEGFPFGAANRRNPPERFGQPWRLVYLGDPLYRLLPPDRRAPRIDGWAPTASWPGYGEYRQPAAGEPDAIRLNWALKTSLFQLERSARPQQRIDLPAVLLAIRRDRLDAPLRPVHDALLIDTLLQADRSADLLERLAHLSPSGRSPIVRRTLEPLQMARLQRMVVARDFAGAMSLWGEVLPTDPTPTFLQTFTDRVAALADTPTRRTDWQIRLRAVRGRLVGRSPMAAIVTAELKRLEQQIADHPR